MCGRQTYELKQVMHAAIRLYKILEQLKFKECYIMAPFTLVS